MCQVVAEIEPGLGPSEVVARIATADGRHEEVTVSEKQVAGGALQAHEIGREDDRVLVELPRESASGRWRIWVKRDQIRS